MAHSGVAEHCATYLASEHKSDASRRDLMFFTILMSSRAVCDIQRGLLHQRTANILAAPPTLECGDSHAKERRSFLFADVPHCARRCSAKLVNDSADNSLDEFRLQPGEGQNVVRGCDQSRVNVATAYTKDTEC